MGDLSFILPPRLPRRPPLECDVHADLAHELDRLGIPYREQYGTGDGRIDFVVWSEHERPYVGIEVKRDLGPHTNASEWADHLEQAAGYARALDVPVLVGPFVDARISSALQPSCLHLGGDWLSAVAAMTIYGGRSNVGVLALLGPSRRMAWALRGKVVLRAEGDRITQFDDAHIRMVRSTNSYKARG